MRYTHYTRYTTRGNEQIEQKVAFSTDVSCDVGLSELEALRRINEWNRTGVWMAKGPNPVTYAYVL